MSKDYQRIEVITGTPKTFADKIRSLVADGPLPEAAEALLRAWEAINTEVAAHPALHVA
jgi:hypothetical protein